EPGIYVNVYDSLDSEHYTIMLDDAAEKRVASKFDDEDRLAVQEWFVGFGIPESEIDISNTELLVNQWFNNFDSSVRLPRMTNADRNYYIRLNNNIQNILSSEGEIIALEDPETAALEATNTIAQNAYVNVGQVPNVRILLLGTDNFGRDVLTELVAATRVSLQIGIVAGLVATAIGLLLGLVSGYVGGFVDDAIMFVTNLFTVIPSFVLLILISFSIGQDQRRAFTIAFVENGTADDVILNPQEPYTRRLISDVPKIYEECDLSTV
ncbi:MAG: hypothetical protein KDE51_07460, partial [Anaerolineales bacterium]|nr:hypothetical protein [Anaerolineales bacterium]